MDLLNFEKSSFFIKGKTTVQYNKEAGNWVLDQSNPIFVANVNLANDEITKRLYSLELGDTPKMRSDFHFLLTFSAIKKEIKNLLLDQYFEVKSTLESFSELPLACFLVILPPGTTVGSHRHHGLTKHTISFIYTQDCKESNSYITIDTKQFTIPCTENKFLLSMYNDPLHDCHNNSGWVFAWVTDYANRISIPTSVTSIYKPIN